MRGRQRTDVSESLWKPREENRTEVLLSMVGRNSGKGSKEKEGRSVHVWFPPPSGSEVVAPAHFVTAKEGGTLLFTPPLMFSSSPAHSSS